MGIVHVVAARLGHADPSVTLRVYAHVIRDQVAAAADIFARSIPASDEAGDPTHLSVPVRLAWEVVHPDGSHVGSQ